MEIADKWQNRHYRRGSANYRNTSVVMMQIILTKITLLTLRKTFNMIQSNALK